MPRALTSTSASASAVAYKDSVSKSAICTHCGTWNELLRKNEIVFSFTDSYYVNAQELTFRHITTRGKAKVHAAESEVLAAQMLQSARAGVQHISHIESQPWATHRHRALQARCGTRCNCTTVSRWCSWCHGHISCNDCQGRSALSWGWGARLALDSGNPRRLPEAWHSLL